METLGFRTKIAAMSALMLGGLTLAGCGAPDHEGAGDGYRVVGVVHDVEKDRTIHINEKQLRVIEAAGKAVEWFADGDGQDMFSDNFNFDPDYNKEGDGFFGGCEQNVMVGKVFDIRGNEIDARDLQSGMVVSITGRIRESTKRKSAGKTTYCGTDDKNVFDTVKIVDTDVFN